MPTLEHPLFKVLANEFRSARACFERAATFAGELQRPEMDFARHIRLLECMAECLDDGLIGQAYSHYPELTDAPKRPTRYQRARQPKTAEETRRAVAKMNGARGGASTSRRKRKASKENGKKGGRPKAGGEPVVKPFEDELAAHQRARSPNSPYGHSFGRQVVVQARSILFHILDDLNAGKKPWAVEQLRTWKVPYSTQIAVERLVARNNSYAAIRPLLDGWSPLPPSEPIE